MGILANYTSKNGIVGNYFNILRGSLVVAPGTTTPRIECLVGFYASEEARRSNSDPMQQFQVNIPLTDLPFDVREILYPALKEQMAVQIPNFSSGGVVTDVLHDTPFKTLADAKASKKVEITFNKIKANRTSFFFQGKQIQADEASMLEIQTTMNGVLARGTLREDWPGGWLAMDNTTVPIPDVETWYAFYAAIEETGQANFTYSRALKALVDTCTTFEQVNSILWGIDLATFVLPLAPEPDPNAEPTTEDPIPPTTSEPPPPPSGPPVSIAPEPDPEPDPEPEPVVDPDS